MSAILTNVDAWVLAALLAAAMLAGWVVGWWSARRLARGGAEGPADKFQDASVGLLGLLLGFTFSMALSCHEQRRLMVVTDSNAIGDFYTCASLVKEPMRAKLRAAIRTYAERRLALATAPPDEAALEKRLDEVQEMQGGMQAMVGEALDGNTPVAVPLVNTFNELTSSHVARLSAARDRLPPSVVGLLLLASVLSMTLLGSQQRGAGRPRFIPMIAFVALVSLAVWVILDLNQPHRGWITVSQEPMQRLLSGMNP